LSREVKCNFILYLKIGRASVDSTEYSRETTVVYTQEYPMPVPMFGIDQMSRFSARCLPIHVLILKGKTKMANTHLCN